MTDNLRRRDATGLYNWPAIAARIVEGWDFTETAAILALADSMTNIAGLAADVTSWDTIREGINEVESNGENPTGRFLCALHTLQWQVVKADIESRGGAIQMRRSFDEAQMAGLGAYKGTYDNVDFFVSSRVPVSTGVYSGMLVAAGGIGSMAIRQAEATASMTVILDVGNGLLTIEEDRDATNKLVEWIGAYTWGTTIVKQGLCCRIRGLGRT